VHEGTCFQIVPFCPNLPTGVCKSEQQVFGCMVVSGEEIRIIESLRLEKTSKIIKSNHQPNSRESLLLQLRDGSESFIQVV